MPRHGDNIRRRKDGRWEGRILLPHPPGQKASYKYVYGYTLREVQEKKNRYIALIYQNSCKESSSCMITTEEQTNSNRISEEKQTGTWEQRIDTAHIKQVKHATGDMSTEDREVSSASDSEEKHQDHKDSCKNSAVHVMTLKEVSEQWLQSKRYQIKESTCSCYTFMLHRYLFPEMGHMPICDITTEHISEYLKHKESANVSNQVNILSPKSLSDIRSLILQIIHYANKQGHHPGLQGYVYSPRVPHHAVSIFTQAEIIQLQSYIQSRIPQQANPSYLGIQIALSTGLRIGEICGLTWGDIDLKKRIICVNRTLQRIQSYDSNSSTKTRLILASPKTSHSIRQVPITDTLYQFIDVYKKAIISLIPSDSDVSMHFQDSNYILSNSSRLVEPRLFLSRYRRILQEAGLPQHTFHEIRHTFASKCIRSGMDAKMLSEILGHSSVTITLARYVHSSMEDKMTEMEKADRSYETIPS